jgi:hypothetical protein
VERFIRGYDRDVQRYVTRTVAGQLKKHSEATTKRIAASINGLMDTLGRKIPAGFIPDIPELKEIKLDWKPFVMDIDYANLPLQEAVNFVSFLVLVQDGQARFARGVPTVGGRTHLGVVTKDKGFQLLDEPALSHRYTGFSDDQ